MAECGPPDCEAQKKKINSVINKTLKKGDTWYLVDIKWFKQWKKYVGYDSWDTYSVGEESAHPGPIDNMALYKEESSTVLREGLIDDLDYFLVPEEGWKDLLDWYGLVEGQEPVCRKVIEQGMFVKHCKVEVYLLDLKLSQNSEPNTTITKQFSRADTIEMLEKEARKVFSIPAEKEVRLWNRYMSNTYEHLHKPENTLQDAGLYQGQVIVIEQKNEDGTWPRQAKSTSTYSISTRSVGYGGSGSHDSGYSSSYYNNYEPAKAPGTPGLCGLANLGNTCFMNSALQCMSNVPVLTNYMLSKKWESELNEENPLGNKGEIAKSYAELVKTIWSGRYSYTVPRNFKVAVGKFAPQFSGYQQQDSQELMAFLLDGLHEDLNRIRKKPYIELKDADGRPDAVVARETWSNYQKRNDSIIVDIFHGLLKSTVQCPDCAKISVTFDPFCYLSLPLPIKKERQMEMFWVPLNPELHPVQDLEEEERICCGSDGRAESPELAEELLPEGHALCPVKLKVTVPKTGCVMDLCKALSVLVDVPPENMMVTDVYNHRFHKLFTPDDGLSHILDRDDIFVYEIPTPSPNIQIVPVYLKEKRTTSGYTGTSQLFGQPFLLAVDKTACTYENVYQRILHRMSRYVRTPEAEDKWWVEDGGEKSSQSEDTPQEDGEAQCNGDVVMEGASDDELEVDRPAMEEGEKPRRLFALQAINSYGNNDGTHRYLPDDGSLLKFSSRTYLAIEWDPIGKKRFFDDKASEVFTEHESLKAKNHQRKQMLTLKDCLNLFLESEKLGEHDPWYCPQCKEHKQATKKFDLWDLPSILIIHLKRFSYSRYWRDKIDVVVDCPLTGLDMEKFSINPAVGKSVYDLIAVSNHYGGLGGGHYTACGKNKDTNKWYYFDDSSVTATDEESIVTKAAYVLVYQKRGLDMEESSKICSASASAAQAPATESRAQASNGYSTEEDQGVQDMDTN